MEDVVFGRLGNGNIRVLLEVTVGFLGRSSLVEELRLDDGDDRRGVYDDDDARRRGGSY